MSNDKQNPYGDAAGTRVGHPASPDRKQDTGSGEESTQGLKGANEGGAPTRPGSEPLEQRENEHLSGYGGKGGAPKTSSDQR